MPERNELVVALVNDYGDTRTITLDLSEPAPWHDADAIDRLVTEAERIANEQNPPHGWPVGVPCGRWTANAHLPVLSETGRLARSHPAHDRPRAIPS
jgi:hypothetical protein